MAVETLGEAYSLGWRVTVRCVHGREDGAHSKSSRECITARTWIWRRFFGRAAERFLSHALKAVCDVPVAGRATSLSSTSLRRTPPPGGASAMCNLYYAD